MNMPSYLQDRLLTPLRRTKQSSRSSQHAGSINFSQKKVTDNIATTSSQQDSWLFHVVATLGGCFAPSLKREKKQAGLPPRDFSAVSSLNDGLSQSSGSSLSSYYAPLGENPKAITFTMAELIKATENFSPSLKIGQGGFGVVYKGRLPDGRLVAIKRARKNEYEMQLSVEFHSELATLTNVEHLNLVKFMGYLDESSERILVVEYVSNGNLRQHLDGKFGTILDVATRLDIAIDVAHAVTYLHLYADQPIIHRDIKSSNVLLTENFRAKVADFGFSRLGPWDVNATHVSTQVKGTAGYLDPEYLKTYQLTQKSDVYSFGVLLVELVTGRSPIELERESEERITTKWTGIPDVS